MKEGKRDGSPIWLLHVGNQELKSCLAYRTNSALFMVHALTNDYLVQMAPAIVEHNNASVKVR